jgi:hypothetical protein
VRDSIPSVQEQKSKNFVISLKHPVKAFGLTTECPPRFTDIYERADSESSIEKSKIDTASYKGQRAKIISTGKGRVHIITPRRIAIKEKISEGNGDGKGKKIPGWGGLGTMTKSLLMSQGYLPGVLKNSKKE